MPSLEDRTGYASSSRSWHNVEFLPLVADVVSWIGLFVCAVGFFLLLSEGLADVFGQTAPAATVGP
jgi:hypothetical protein